MRLLGKCRGLHVVMNFPIRVQLFSNNALDGVPVSLAYSRHIKENMHTYYTHYGTVSPLLLHALSQLTPPQNYYKGSSLRTNSRNSAAPAPSTRVSRKPQNPTTQTH